MTGQRVSANRTIDRIALGFCLVVFIGCSREPVPNVVERGSDAEVEDGGTVKSADREKVEAFFAELSKVQSIGEEEKLLTEFGEWLREHNYKIRIEQKNGKYDLSCPYFPPVTPWITHAFLDVKNLELLPAIDHGE